MVSDADGLTRQVAELRRQFDLGFAAAHAEQREEPVPLLVIRVGGQPQALSVAELASFMACGRLTAVPGQRPECLGLAGFRGRPIAVFSLAALLGSTLPEPAPRWLAVGAGATPLGVAVAAFDGQIQAPRRAIHLHDAPGAVRRTLHLGALVCPLLDLPALLEPLILRTRPAAPAAKE